jgi:threonine aldolase
MDFSSDNTAGAAPEVWAALAQANSGTAPSYGDDPWTVRAQALTSKAFERELAMFPVVSGMAANCLALSVLCPRFGAVFVHEDAHLLANESTAPEFYVQARLVPVPGQHGKIDPEALRRFIARHGRGNVHAAQPSVLSLTQTTEVGTIYTTDEIRTLANIAHDAGMTVHLDGARFANAVAALGVSPAEASWKAGVDAMSFGLTKTGALNAESVIFFDPRLVQDFTYQRKRAAHLVSKMRFLSAQFVAMLEGDLWLDLANLANKKAETISRGLCKIPGVSFDISVQSNSIFPVVPANLLSYLNSKNVQFYAWGPPELDGRQRIRLVTSFATSEQEVSRFLDIAASFQEN